MKKNILTIVIMAACLINLVLSAVLVFSVMPAMNKTSKLVDKVASVIDLEIDSGEDEEDSYTVDDLTTVEITYDSSVKIKLQQDEGDDSAHYALLDGIVVFFNSKAEDCDAVYKSISETNVYVSDIVKDVIGEYSATSISETTVKEEAVKRLQEKYNTKSIVEISLTGFLPV
jgi:flagellar FliL protein